MERDMGKIDWLDRINPVVIKELRQSMNSKTMQLCCVGTVLLLLYSTVCIQHWGTFGVLPDSISFEDINGKALFYVATGIMALVGVFMGGVLGMFRYARERAVADLDVGNFTALSAFRLVLGRFLASLTIVLYVYSLCLPLFVTAICFCGISLGDMFWTHVYVLALVVCVNQLLLSVGACGKQSLGIFVCLLIGGICPGFMVLIFDELRMGNYMTPIMLQFLMFSLMFIGLSFMVNVVQLSAVHSNRLFGLKCLLLVYLVVDVLLCWYILAHQGTMDGCFTSWMLEASIRDGFVDARADFCVIAYFIFAVSLVVSGVNAPDHVSLRVREKCPDNPVLRAVFYMLSSGFGGGVILGGLLLIAGIGCLVGVPALSKDYPIQSNLCLFLLNMAGYLVFYVVAADVIHRFAVGSCRERLAVWLTVLLNVLPLLLWILLLTGGQSFFYALDDKTKSFLFDVLTFFSFVHGVEELVKSGNFAFNDLTDVLYGLQGVFLAGGVTLLALPFIIKDFLAFRKPDEKEWQQLLNPQVDAWGGRADGEAEKRP